jgi:hypothetical protein
MTPEETSIVWEGVSRSFEGRLVKAYLTLEDDFAGLEVWSSSSAGVRVWGAAFGVETAAAAEDDDLTGVGSIWR